MMTRFMRLQAIALGTALMAGIWGQMPADASESSYRPDTFQQIASLKATIDGPSRLDYGKIALEAAKLIPSFGVPSFGVSAQSDAQSPVDILNTDTLGKRLELTNVPIDLVLSQIAMQVGTNHHIELKAAQGQTNAPVLTLRAGAFTLDKLYQAAEKAKLSGYLTVDSGIYQLNKPLFIMGKARLKIGEDERLILSRQSGAFIINIGQLSISGSVVKGGGEPNHVADFAPFIITALGGKTRIVDSELSNLGFQDRPVMRGLSFVSNPFFPVKTGVTLKGNRFDNIHSVELIGIEGFSVASNIFEETEGSSLRIQDSSAGSITGNLFASSKRHGLHILQNSKDVTVQNNILINGQGAGIYVAGGVTGLHIIDNLVMENSKSGIALSSAYCADIRGNALFENGLRGVLAKKSQEIEFNHNLFAHNLGPAITIDGGLMFDRNSLRVSKNRFIANRVGLQASQFSKIVLMGNDFSAQLPVLFSGALRPYLPRYLSSISKMSSGVPSPFLMSGAVLPSAARSGVEGFVLSNLESCNL